MELETIKTVCMIVSYASLAGLGVIVFLSHKLNWSDTKKLKAGFILMIPMFISAIIAFSCHFLWSSI